MTEYLYDHDIQIVVNQEKFSTIRLSQNKQISIRLNKNERMNVRREIILLLKNEKTFFILRKGSNARKKYTPNKERATKNVFFLPK